MQSQCVVSASTMYMPARITSRAASGLLFAVPVITVVVGAVFNIATLAGDYWMRLALKDSTVRQGFGLWRMCTSELAGYRTSCVRLNDRPELARLIGGPDYIVTARALSLLALVAGCITIPLAVVAFVAAMKKHPIVSLTASFSAAISSLALQAACLSVALILYTTIFKRTVEPLIPAVTVRLGWSFILGCVGVGFYVTGCASFVCGALMSYHHHQHSKLRPSVSVGDDVEPSLEKPALVSFVEPVSKFDSKHRDASLKVTTVSVDRSPTFPILSSSSLIDTEVPSLSLLVSMSVGDGQSLSSSPTDSTTALCLRSYRSSSSSCHGNNNRSKDKKNNQQRSTHV